MLDPSTTTTHLRGFQGRHITWLVLTCLKLKENPACWQIVAIRLVWNSYAVSAAGECADLPAAKTPAPWEVPLKIPCAAAKDFKDEAGNLLIALTCQRLSRVSKVQCYPRPNYWLKINPILRPMCQHGCLGSYRVNTCSIIWKRAYLCINGCVFFRTCGSYCFFSTHRRIIIIFFTKLHFFFVSMKRATEYCGKFPWTH